MDKQIEIWRDVKGYEKYYQVSNLGNVKSKFRLSKTGNGYKRNHPKIMKPVPNSKGYLRVNFTINGKHKYKFIHRLVAEAFCEHFDGCNVVNHLDSNFLNNNAANLEWTTLKGNSQHALKNGRLQRNSEWLERQRNSLRKYDKPVIAIKSDNPLEKKFFVSIAEAGRNGFEPSSICWCCKGKRKTHKGYYWKYA